VQLPDGLRVTRNYPLIINCKFLQNTIWVCSKFVGAIANCYLPSDIINATGKCNVVGTLGITPNDEE